MKAVPLIGSFMNGFKIHLIQAYKQYLESQGYEVLVYVNCDHKDVLVPEQHIKDGGIVLDITSSRELVFDTDGDYITAYMRFKGSDTYVVIPVAAIETIYFAVPDISMTEYSYQGPLFFIFPDAFSLSTSITEEDSIDPPKVENAKDNHDQPTPKKVPHLKLVKK